MKRVDWNSGEDIVRVAGDEQLVQDILSMLDSEELMSCSPQHMSRLLSQKILRDLEEQIKMVAEKDKRLNLKKRDHLAPSFSLSRAKDE